MPENEDAIIAAARRVVANYELNGISRSSLPEAIELLRDRLKAQAAPESKKELLLTLAVPGVWADDLDETAAEYYRGDCLEYVLDPDGMGLDPKVHITIVTTGDESGPVVYSYDCTVVGAASRDRA